VVEERAADKAGAEGAEGPSPFLLKRSSTLNYAETQQDALVQAQHDASERVPWLVEVAVVSQRMFR
jgi:hypothetical protein